MAVLLAEAEPAVLGDIGFLLSLFWALFSCLGSYFIIFVLILHLFVILKVWVKLPVKEVKKIATKVSDHA